MKPSLAAVPLANFLMKAVPLGEEQLRSSGDIQGGQGLKGPVGPAPRRPPPTPAFSGSHTCAAVSPVPGCGAACPRRTGRSHCCCCYSSPIRRRAWRSRSLGSWNPGSQATVDADPAPVPGPPVAAEDFCSVQLPSLWSPIHGAFQVGRCQPRPLTCSPHHPRQCRFQFCCLRETENWDLDPFFLGLARDLTGGPTRDLQRVIHFSHPLGSSVTEASMISKRLSPPLHTLRGGKPPGQTLKAKRGDVSDREGAPLVAQTVKNVETVKNAGNVGWIPGSGRAPGEGNSYSLQYSCLENSRDRGAWQAIVHGVTKTQT